MLSNALNRQFPLKEMASAQVKTTLESPRKCVFHRRALVKPQTSATGEQPQQPDSPMTSQDAKPFVFTSSKEDFRFNFFWTIYWGKMVSHRPPTGNPVVCCLVWRYSCKCKKWELTLTTKWGKDNLPSHKMCTIFCVLYLYIKVFQNVQKINILFFLMFVLYFILNLKCSKNKYVLFLQVCFVFYIQLAWKTTVKLPFLMSWEKYFHILK